MYDLLLVQILQGRDDLSQIALNFEFNQSFSSFDELIQSLVGTDLKEDVNVFVVFEDVLKLYNMLVVQRLVDFDFRN